MEDIPLLLLVQNAIANPPKRSFKWLWFLIAITALALLPFILMAFGIGLPACFQQNTPKSVDGHNVPINNCLRNIYIDYNKKASHQVQTNLPACRGSTDSSAIKSACKRHSRMHFQADYEQSLHHKPVSAALNQTFTFRKRTISMELRANRNNLLYLQLNANNQTYNMLLNLQSNQTTLVHSFGNDTLETCKKVNCLYRSDSQMKNISFGSFSIGPLSVANYSGPIEFLTENSVDGVFGINDNNFWKAINNQHPFLTSKFAIQFAQLNGTGEISLHFGNALSRNLMFFDSRYINGSWAIQVNRIYFSNHILISENRRIVFDTTVPYIYAPAEDFKLLQREIYNPDILHNISSAIMCSASKGSLVGLRFEIGNCFFELSPRDYLSLDRNYLPCFSTLQPSAHSSHNSSTDWVFGVEFLRLFNAVFDMDKARIGIGRH